MAMPPMIQTFDFAIGKGQRSLRILFLHCRDGWRIPNDCADLGGILEGRVVSRSHRYPGVDYSLVPMSDGLLMIRKNSANITLEIEEI